MQIKDIASFAGLTKRKEVSQVPEHSTVPQIDLKSYGEKVVEYSWTAPDRVLNEIPQKTAKTFIIIAAIYKPNN